MKYYITIATLVILSFSAWTEERLPPVLKLNPKLVPLALSSDNSSKGDLYLDPIYCWFYIKRENLLISLISEVDSTGKSVDNFLVTFSDGDTVVGRISDAAERNFVCWHSLTTNSNAYKVIPLIAGTIGLENCLKRTNQEKNAAVTTELLLVSGFENAKQPSMKIERGAGITFYNEAFESQSGSNITRADLKPNNPKYIAKCSAAAPSLPGFKKDHKATPAAPEGQAK